MKWKWSALGRRWRFALPLLFGIAVAALLVLRRESPQLEPVPEAVRAVRVIRAEPVAVVSRTLGYGTVGPGGDQGPFRLPAGRCREPLIVMAAIPLALIGVVAGHLVMNIQLSMPSILGFVSLAGIVVNDSLLLVLLVIPCLYVILNDLGWTSNKNAERE